MLIDYFLLLMYHIYLPVCGPFISIMQELALEISRLLKGLTLTATLTEDILKPVTKKGVIYLMCFVHAAPRLDISRYVRTMQSIICNIFYELSYTPAFLGFVRYQRFAIERLIQWTTIQFGTCIIVPCKAVLLGSDCRTI